MIPLKDDNPTRTTPFVNYGLIIANIAVFIYMLYLGPAVSEKFVLGYSVRPREIFGAGAHPGLQDYTRVLTSMFLHGGLLHLAGNMLFLWIFGDNIEDFLGHGKYLLFYVACGVAAVCAHGLSHPGSGLPMLGASGAISGVLGAYLVLYPKAGVWTFFFFIFFWQVIKVPAVFIIGLWIVVQVANGLLYYNKAGGGVAWFAHVGGFITGIVLILILRGHSRAQRVEA
jgi:membrane associated rhomboid family serine protease